MKVIESIKAWIGAITDVGLMLLALAIVATLLVGGNLPFFVGLMLLALAIVATLLVGGNLPFFGAVVSNIVALIKDLGANGLVGLIVLGLIIWLFSKRSVS